MAERRFACTVTSIEPDYVTVLSNVAWHKVDASKMRKTVGLGAKGVVTVVKGEVRALEVPFALEELKSLWKVDLDVYSADIYPRSVLASEDRTAQIAIQLISRKCVGVRKCTGGFVRALTVGYIEHLLRKSTPIAYLQQLIEWSEQLLAGSTLDYYRGVTEKLRKLEMYKGTGKSTLKWLAKQSKEKPYWIQMASFLRNVLFPSFLRDSAVIASLGGLTEAEVAQQAETDPDSSLFPAIMACALNLRLVVFSPDNYKTCYQTSVPNQHLAVIMLYKEGKMCHLLYSNAMLELENYSLDCMMPGSGGGYNPKLYYTTPNREKRAEISELDAKLIGRRITKMCRFGLEAEKLVETLLGMWISKSSTEVIARESQQFQQESTPQLLQLREFLDTNPLANTEWTQHLAQAQLLDFLTSLHLSSLRPGPSLKICQSCHREFPKEHFPSLCSCKLCIFCLCDAYRRQPANCPCRDLQSPDFLLQLQNHKVLCPNCLEKKSALFFYSEVQCEDHCLCRQCLASQTGEQPRCFYCKRAYNDREIAVIKLRRCMFYTKFCASEMLETECGCAICLKCEKELANRMQISTQCFGCGQFLSSSASVRLSSLLKEGENADFPLCALCGSLISVKTDIFKLGCSHTFHQICFRDDTERTKDFLTCPVDSCDYRPSLRVLQRPFPDLYAKLEGAQSNAVCPQCEVSVNIGGRAGKVHNSEVICPNCYYHFCLYCLQQYSNPHSPLLCAEKQLHNETTFLQRQAKATDRVLQCAGCQHSLLAPVDSPEVQCKTCSMIMCASCAVPKHVYAVHGSAWHRTSCPRHCGDSQKEGFCLQCRNLGRKCTPPKD